MASLYPPWSNSVYRLAIAGLALGAAGAVVGPMVYARTPYNTSQLVAWEQPVEFDHRHHVRDDGIECLYCHSSAETAPTAGVPTTAVCMGCHVQVWSDSPLLEPVRRSYFSGEPIRWRRVHNLPDFVYFHHGVHVQGGVPCERCHGDVGAMPRVAQVAPLTMGWCLDCHRSPETRIASGTLPAEMWSATVDMMAEQPEAEPAVSSLTTCSACHR